MVDVLGSTTLPQHSVALGSVKSNIGHLNGAAGAAGMLKATLALHHKVLPPSLNCQRPSPDIDFAHSPLYVNTELRPWNVPADVVRRCGVSAFGFGGTNFHMVMEEHVPGKLNGNGKKSVSVPVHVPAAQPAVIQAAPPDVTFHSNHKPPLRGAMVLGAATAEGLLTRLQAVTKAAQAGQAPPFAPPAEADLRAPERLAIDYADAADLAGKCAIALKAFAANQPAFWKALRAQGIFRGHGPAPKVAFLYTGQGSQYVNMTRALRQAEPVVAETFAEADRIMTPLLGKPLTEFIFVDPQNAEAVAKAEDDLRQTAITQPAVISINIATTRLLGAYGIKPDMTMGHSVGEYGALVAAGAMPFADALEAVSARGREMTRVSMADNGKMAAVFAPIAEVERLLKTVDGYVVIANVNSNTQSVIGGATKAVEQAAQIFLAAGFNVVELPVSHAFHTSIVAPASEPLRTMLQRLHIESPKLPIIANIHGEFYPTGPGVSSQMVDMLAQQVAAPVQFVKGLRTLYDAGARVFLEVGPKKALQGFADDVLGSDSEVFSLFTNHPKLDDLTAFNQALCGLYAAGLGCTHANVNAEAADVASAPVAKPTVQTVTAAAQPASIPHPPIAQDAERYNELGRMLSEVLQSGGWKLSRDREPVATTQPVVITGAAIGLPGTDHIFDDANIARLLNGDQFISAIPDEFRRAMLDKNITRLVKTETGDASFETIGDVADVIKLAGRGRTFDFEDEFGISGERLAALDRVTCLAMAVGIDALRDAGIPLVMRYKTTTKGTQLPDRWSLPDSLRDETGIIFGSAFPGCDSFAEMMGNYYTDRALRQELAMLEKWSAQSANGHSAIGNHVAERIDELRRILQEKPFVFDRRFLFRVLSMGHSQFAEYIGARGPNTQINSACATTTQAVSLAADWIRDGRCKRVIVISADDVTSDNMIEWFGAGFLASGAAATDEVIEDAATPFDKRRHGLIMGMGAAALVLESAEAARERGIRPICEVLAEVTANSAFHGTRLDVQHISGLMEELISSAERRHGISRQEIAPKTVFVSHETYTPARGGSASAEVFALRQTFGALADQIVVANTKGYTGHAMATGIEDVLAVKALETGVVPPVPNFKEVDPELGTLNLSKGGSYPVEYALRLGAGFGSQISLTLVRWTKTPDGSRTLPQDLGYKSRIADPARWEAWLRDIADRQNAELEVVKHTLRVRDLGPQARPAQRPESVRAVDPAPAVAEAKPAPAMVSRQKIAGITEDTPAPVAATETAAAPAASDSLAGKESVKDRILALVVQKTGYPADMLDLDLDLEADLGVDTVKQAEIFASIRQMYNIARDENRKLRDYPTLNHVIRFVLENRPELAGTVPPPPPQSGTPKLEVEARPPATAATEPKTAAQPSAPTSNESVREKILALVVEKTGYPMEMLDVDLDLEADLGVDTVKQAEMFAAIRGIYNIPRDENLKLRDYPTLAHVIRFVEEKRPDLASTAYPAPPPMPVSVAAATSSSVEHSAVASAEPAPVADSPIASDISVSERILDLVVEKTGYPREMLDLDLDLEADLGVDTVKQAEMFAAIRGIYNIPRDENLKLRDYPTLAHVIRFVEEKRPDLAAAVATAPTGVEHSTLAASTPEPGPTASPAPATAGDSEAVKKRILALVVEKTGYPEDMLDLELDLEADLGVDTVKQAEMFAAIREIYNIPRDENRKLRDYPTLGHVIRFVFEMRPDLAGARPAAPVVSDVKDFAPQPSPTVAELPKPAVPAAPLPTSQSTVAPALDLQAIQEKVLGIVAEKTGYPKEMLDFDLDLEADLGIDTVKQAEMFASVRAAYNIPRDENLKLRDFPTLAHVIKFAQDRAALGNSTALAPVAEAPPEATRAQAPPLLTFEAANKVPRRVPIPVLRPPLALCNPTGVALGQGSRVLIVSDRSGVADELAKQLKANGIDTLVMFASTKGDRFLQELDSLLGGKPVQGVYWLPALDRETPLSTMSSEEWRDALQVRVKSLYLAMRKLYEQVAQRGTFLIAATHLGGQHGYDEAGAAAPMGGAVTGFAKAYKREHTDALVKAVDFADDSNAATITRILIDETLRDNGAVEIGYKDDLRWTVGLEEQPAADGVAGLALDQNSVFVVTGAAGSIVSAITADLATASGGTFYLLDLVPEPDAKNPDLAKFATDKDGLKRDLFARIQARGERATPALVEKELAALERAQAALSAIQAVQAAGGTAHYCSVNLADPEAIAKVIEQVRQNSGRIDVLLHAAGLERSHFLPDKDQHEFDLVFDVKANGWFNLLRAIADMPLGATVAFSSVAGRFGNAGQTDYSAANDLLCKYTSSFRTTRPQTRAIVIDWTAWGGIGMATRGSIPKMMEMAGIEMLPPEAGIPLIRRELTSGGTRGEVVVGLRLGALLNEWDATGGVNTSALTAASDLLAKQGPMVGRITGVGVYSGLTMETTLDPTVQPFLNDHRIDGTPVLPGVMGIEAFAEAALCLHPGWHIEAIEEVSFLAPFKFYKDEPRAVIIQALIHPLGSKLIADCKLIGRRRLVGQTELQETTHFTARVRVARQIPDAITGPKPMLTAEGLVEAAQIYRIYFHGPAYQVVEKAWWDGENMVGELVAELPDECTPADRRTVIGPRLIELCFQTAGLWEIAAQGRMGLPWQVGSVTWLRQPDSAGRRFYAVVTPRAEQGSFDAEVVDGEGNRYVRLMGYRTSEVPSSIDGDRLKPLHDAVSQPVV